MIIPSGAIRLEGNVGLTGRSAMISSRLRSILDLSNHSRDKKIYCKQVALDGFN